MCPLKRGVRLMEVSAYRGSTVYIYIYISVCKHAEQYDHRIDFSNATIVNKTKNYRERLFLEAWYSLKDYNAGNDHVEIPDMFKTLIC
jgi:hypothetical protein